MSNAARFSLGSAALVIAVGLVLTLAPGQGRPVSGARPSPTPYHEGQPNPMGSPFPMTTPAFPIPEAQDLATADTMTAAGAAMIRAAEGMAETATTMIASGVPALVDLGGHWAQDARALRERGAWMVLAATADSMVHDPDNARELNLQNLRGNGLSMTAEGQAMVDHGEEMLAAVEQLRRDAAVEDGVATELSNQANALIAAGQALQRDGERMRQYAENLLRSIGQ